MNSEAVQKKFGRDAKCWNRWNDFDPKEAPHSLGVYVFRVAGGSEIERVKRASDIVYVGSGKIRDRLKAHANPDWENWDDSGWLISLIAQARNLEVSWAELPEEKARTLESKILEEYIASHFELPPANRQLHQLSEITRGEIVLRSVSPEVREKLLGQVRVSARTFKGGQ